VERDTGFRDSALNTSPVPDDFGWWMGLFSTIRRGETITFQDIDAFERVTCVKLNPMEIDVILAMDKGASAAMAEILRKPAAKPIGVV